MKRTLSPGAPQRVTQFLADWLDGELGRGQYFSKVDPELIPPIISKIKKGVIRIRFEMALRLERAQKPSATPFKAEDLLAYEEDLQLLRYARGQEPAPQPKSAK